jgi:micrococcal nuclease
MPSFRLPARRRADLLPRCGFHWWEIQLIIWRLNLRLFMAFVTAILRGVKVHHPRCGSRQTVFAAHRCSALMVVFLLSAPLFGADFSGRVVRVIDGDSIEVLHEGRAEQVRLNGIDCPELGQAFGKRARQFTSQLAFGKEVALKVAGYDRYDRTIAEVALPDGKDLNRELVKAGYAWWYRKYAPNDRILERLETKARNARLGLWADPNPIPPWEFRRTHGRIDVK